MNKLQRKTIHFLVLTMLLSEGLSLLMTTGTRRVRAATIWVVTNKNSSGDGSLPSALQRAVSGDTVRFAPSVTGELVISGLALHAGVTIAGPGADKLTLWGSQRAP